MDIFEVIKDRRSIRKFYDKPIPKDILKKILDAGCWAPSACNRQLWEFVIVENTETKKRIADEACFGQKFLKEAPTLVVVFYDDTKERREESKPYKYDSIQSAAAAIQNMHLAAHALGIGSLWVCAIKRMLKLNEILNVPKTIRPIAIVALGYPKEKPVPPKRRPPSSFIHEEKFRQLQYSYPNSVRLKDWTVKELAFYRSEICWFGGTITPESTLEKYSMKSQTYSYLMDMVKKNIKSNDQILDILPYAGGYLAGIMKQNVKPNQVTAFELDIGNIDFIKQNLKSLHIPEPVFLLNQGDKIEFNTEPKDVITCFFRFEKIPDSHNMLQEMYCVLKKGGKILFATELKGLTGLGIQNYQKREQNFHTSRLWNTGPVLRRNRKQILKIVKKVGFKIHMRKIFIEDSWIKFVAKQFLRSSGCTLFMILEKQ